MSVPPPTAPDLLTHTFLAMEQGAPDPRDVYFGVLLRCAGETPQLERLRTRIASRIGSLPALTHRITAGAWEADPGFDIGRHVRLAEPGPVATAPIHTWMTEAPSHDHPLWRMWLLPGEGAGWGLVFAVHHAVLDGTAVLGALEILFADREPTAVDAAARGGLSALDAVPNVLRTLRPAPELPVFGPASGERRLDVATVPVGDLRAVADATGATIGQAHLAAFAGAVRTWAAGSATRRDVPVCVPIDTRRPREAGRSGVHLGLFRVALPTAVDDPVRRLRRVTRRLSRRRVARARSAARALIDHVPPRWSGPAMKRLGDRRNVALTVSAFRSMPSFDLLGRPVEEVVALPWLPPGHGCFTILTRYRDRATLSVLTDTGVVDPSALAESWAREVALLVAAAGARSTR